MNLKSIVRLSLLAVCGIAMSLAPFAGAQNLGGFQDTPIIPGTKWHVHDNFRPQPRVVTPGATFSQGAPAPSDAVVLFDGKDLSKWQTSDGKEAKWKVQDGYMEASKPAGIRTKDKFGDFQLHVEWATPTPAAGTSQGRGNSGVIMNGLYEVQVLDNYNAKTYADGQAGALYGQAPPLVNASLPPGTWQTYDILFESARWDKSGELTKKSTVTVIHNGVVIHNHKEYIGYTDGSAGVPYKSLSNYNKEHKHEPEVYIELQYHNNAVRYRNVWIRTIGEYDTAEADVEKK